MKYRNGFVANSSTSSFVAVGWTVTLEEMIELLKGFGIDTSEMESEDGSFYDIEYENDCHRIEIDGKKVPTLMCTGYDNDWYVVGYRLHEGMKASVVSDDNIKKLIEMYPSIYEKHGEPTLAMDAWTDG